MIKSIQTLRVLFIVMVFLAHLSYLKNVEQYKEFFERYLYDGFCGVTFFCILSGFVIAYKYYNKFNVLNKKAIKEFYKKRLFKIYPIHIFTFIIAVIIDIKILVRDPMNTFVNGFFNITLTQSFIPSRDVYFSYNGVSWYLSILIFFYLLTPFLLKIIEKLVSEKISLWKVIILIYVFQISYVLIFRNNEYNHWLIYINPLFRMFEYINGLLLGTIALINKRKVNIKKGTVYEGITIGLFCLAYYFHPSVDLMFRYGAYYFPIMIMVIYIFSKEAGYISKIFMNKFSVYLGNISIYFYMIHQLVLKGVQHIISIKYPISIAVLGFIISFISSIVLNKSFKKVNKYIGQVVFAK